MAFLGRSNVGKSSLINRLLGTTGLARTSSQPGCTQSVNFYRVNERFHFMDVPGYGWARASQAIRRSWKPLVEGLLERRRSRLALALIVVDARHPPSPLDRTMQQWLEAQQLDYAVVATKADTLSAAGRARAARELAAGFGLTPLFVSAKTGLGVPELWRQLEGALAPAPQERE